MTSQPDPTGTTQSLGAAPTTPIPAGPPAPGMPSAGMPTPSGPTPQDAPLDQPWPPRPEQSGSPVPGASPAPPSEPPAPAPWQSGPAEPIRRVIPAPTGANWPLVVVALLLVLAAAAEIAYLFGFRTDGDLRIGPGALIGAGALLVLVGVVGMLGQRSRSR